MPSHTFLILLVILNLLTMHYAYRIDPNDDLIQALFRKYEAKASDGEIDLADLYNNFKQVEDDNDLIPCRRKSSSILSNKLSRRDTGFLRFGRKR